MLLLLTLAPTIIGFGLMVAFVLLDMPVDLRQFGWLFSEAQGTTLILGIAAMILKKLCSAKANHLSDTRDKTLEINTEPQESRHSETFTRLSHGREFANRWIGRLLVAVVIFYVFAFALTAHRGI